MFLEHPKHERSAKPRPLGRGAHRVFDISIKKEEGISGYYLVKNYSGELRTRNEINEMKWVTKEEIEKGPLNVSEAARLLAVVLNKEGLL